MAELTDAQKQILTAITELTEENHCPPSVRELCDRVGMSSPCSVHRHLKALEVKGYIARRKFTNRGITVLRGIDYRTTPKRTVTIPLVGAVAAGEPLLAEENIETAFAVSTELVPDEDSFMLRVKGNSMVGAGIFDGDLVVVRRQPSADNGDIVAALLGEEATVKRFYRENGHIRLQPENPAYEPIISDDVAILGKVTLVVRKV